MIDVGADLQRAYDDGYAHGIADAMKWIPCSERLPEPYVKVLVSDVDGDVEIGWFEEHFNEWWSGRYGLIEVLAWMPLPPYKEGDDGTR